MAKKRSASSKGKQYQREARRILESQGYECEMARPKIVWVAPRRPISVGEDFFSRIDIIAVHPERPPLFVQVSVQTELSRKRSSLIAWRPHGIEVEVWLRQTGRPCGFRVYRYPFVGESAFVQRTIGQAPI